MDEYVLGQLIYRTPTCHHIFHDECMRSWLLSKNQEREQRCPLCNVPLDITILRDLKKEKEKKEMNGFKDRPSDSKNKVIHQPSSNNSMSEDRNLLKELRDISTLEYNPGVGEYNPDNEIDSLKKDTTDKNRDSILGSLDQIQSWKT